MGVNWRSLKKMLTKTILPLYPIIQPIGNMMNSMTIFRLLPSIIVSVCVFGIYRFLHDYSGT